MSPPKIPPAVEGSAARPGEANRIHVVLVSNSPNDHLQLRNVFRGAAWRVSSAHDLTSAVEHIRAGERPIIICSDEMNGGGWRELLEHTRDLVPSPVFILTTASADNHVWRDALARGAHDVMYKPYDAREVLQVVRTGWGRTAQSMQYASAVG